MDFIERGKEAAFSLRRILAGLASPRMMHVKLPLVPTSIALLTAAGPYGDLIDFGQRRQAELRGAILNVSVFGNFIFPDTPSNNISVVVTARNDRAVAEVGYAQSFRLQSDPSHRGRSNGHRHQPSPGDLFRCW